MKTDTPLPVSPVDEPAQQSAAGATERIARLLYVRSCTDQGPGRAISEWERLSVAVKSVYLDEARAYESLRATALWPDLRQGDHPYVRIAGLQGVGDAADYLARHPGDDYAQRHLAERVAEFCQAHGVGQHAPNTGWLRAEIQKLQDASAGSADKRCDWDAYEQVLNLFGREGGVGGH